MQFVLTILLLIFSYYGMQAKDREITDVLSIAQKHWMSVNKTSTRSNLNMILVAEKIDNQFYVVRRDYESGFVIVPVSNAMPEIIAYAENANFPTEGLPRHIKSWMEDYAYMEEVGMTDPTTLKAWLLSSFQGYSDMSPLLDGILWGQDEPYNFICPTIEGERCPTGCVATALAQIMNFHNWPRQGSGSIRYTTDTHNIPISYNFEELFIDWEHIYDVYGYEEIEPGYGMTIVYGDNYTFSRMEVDEVYSTARCEIKVMSMYTNRSRNFRGDAVLMLADEDGNIIQQASDIVRISNGIGSMVSANLDFSLTVPSYMADGRYRIYCALRSKDYDSWEIANISGKGPMSDANYHWLEKVGRYIELDGKVFPCAASGEEVKAVSSLMSAVGAAVEMDYAPDASGAYNHNALKGMREYLSYDRDMLLMEASDFTDSQWHHTLQKELSEGRPVYYSGNDGQSGHAFVIDGMQTNQDGVVYYHINWGWDGWCDGYYLLNMLRPEFSGTGGTASGNYSNGANMIIGIAPEDGVDHLRMTCGGISLLSDTVYPGQNLYPSIVSLHTSTDFEGELSLVLQNKDSLEQAPITIFEESDISISDARGLKNHKIMCTLPKDVPSGDYELCIICTGTDGVGAELDCESWPQIHIEDIEKWYGGEYSSVQQYVGLQNCYITTEDYPQHRIVLNIGTSWNITSEVLSGKVALLVCDDKGTVLTPMNEERTLILNGYAKKGDFQIGASFAKGMPDGSYLLCLGFRLGDSEQWTLGYEMNDEATSLWDTRLSPFSIPFEVVSGNAYFADCIVPGVDGIVWTNVKCLEHDEARKRKFHNLNGWNSYPIWNDIYIIGDKKVLINNSSN